MPHVFDSRNFEALLTDTGRLVAHARSHETALSDLVELIEARGEIRLDSTRNGPLPTLQRTEVLPGSEWTASTDVFRQVRASCVAARTQREIAERIQFALLGEIEADSFQRPHVLVVDDSQESRELAATVLENSGFHTITADNGLDGLIAAHCLRPVVALMDLNMPVLDGIAAARLLSTSPATRDVKVIAYTARADFYEGPLTRFFAGFLTKPAMPETIVNKVLHFVQP